MKSDNEMQFFLLQSKEWARRTFGRQKRKGDSRYVGKMFTVLGHGTDLYCSLGASQTESLNPFRQLGLYYDTALTQLHFSYTMNL